MSKRIKEYTKTNVLDASKKRIKKQIAISDEVWVGFSGGKDSLVVLSLVESLSKDKKINVVFRDEEMINTEVVRFVQEKAKNERYNFVYIATQLHSDITILGESKPYIQWDEDREWIREKPKNALVYKGVKKQEDFEKWFFNGSKAKISLMLGVRADESFMRNAGFTKSRHPEWRPTDLKNVTICNPIYDWGEKDIFKYLIENSIEYCKTYDFQVFEREPLRVSSVLHAEASRQLKTLKNKDPILYEQIFSIFPQIELQNRYGKQVLKSNKWIKDIQEWRDKVGDPFVAIVKWAEENLEGIKREQALKLIYKSKQGRESRKKTHPDSLYGGYPYFHIFKNVIQGKIKRARLMPTPDEKEIYKKYEDMEKIV